jgi:hypothetical protein
MRNKTERNPQFGSICLSVFCSKSTARGQILDPADCAWSCVTMAAGSIRRFGDGIHAQKDYVELEGAFIGLELERHDPSLPGAD